MHQVLEIQDVDMPEPEGGDGGHFGTEESGQSSGSGQSDSGNEGDSPNDDG